MVAAVADAGDGLNLHVRTLAQGLLHEMIRQLTAGKGVKAGVVLHLGGEGDLPAEGALFQQQDGLIRPAGVDGGGEPRRARADDDDIVHSCYLANEK